MADIYNIEVNCDHLETFLKVIGSAATCETTLIVCTDCGEILSNPKTDC